MKIAVFYNLKFGGAKRVVYEHVKGLASRGHHLTVYTTDQYSDSFDPGSAAHEEYRYALNEKNLNIPVLGRIQKDLTTFISLKNLHHKIAQEIDQSDYDIVLVHTDTLTQAPFILQFLKTENVYFCLEPLRIAYEYGLKIPHNFPFFLKPYEILTRYHRKMIDQTNARAARNTLALSLFDREYMIHAYDLFPKVSYLGVNEKIFRPLSIAKKNQVFFLAEKLKLSGYDYAMQALEKIPKAIRPELKILSWTKDPAKRLSDTEVVKLYNESLVTLSLSTYDTFGLIPLESMSCSTPVIAFNVAGYRETMLDHKTGFLVDFNAQEIADKIMFLQKNPEKAQEMGKAGREWIEKTWTWEKQIIILEKLLLSFIEKR